MTDLPLNVEQLNAMLVESPFHQLLGVSVEEYDDERGVLVLRVPLADKIERAQGTKQHHGGTIASLIDIAGDFAVIREVGYGVPTINFRTDYMRPAIDTDLIAEARVRRIGRTVSICDIDILSENGKVLAIGRGTYATKAG